MKVLVVTMDKSEKVLPSYLVRAYYGSPLKMKSRQAVLLPYDTVPQINFKKEMKKLKIFFKRISSGKDIRVYSGTAPDVFETIFETRKIFSQEEAQPSVCRTCQGSNFYTNPMGTLTCNVCHPDPRGGGGN